MARFLVPQRSIVVMRECSLEETLPAGHLARFIWSALERIDFGAIEGRYQSVAKCSGRPPYHPRILGSPQKLRTSVFDPQPVGVHKKHFRLFRNLPIKSMRRIQTKVFYGLDDMDQSTWPRRH